MTSHGGTHTPFSQSLWFLTPHSICLHLVPSHLGPRSLPAATAHRGMVYVYTAVSITPSFSFLHYFLSSPSWDQQ